jgi:hypothetical protein
LYVTCCRLSPWAYGVTRLYSQGPSEFTNHSEASIWACARQVSDTFHANRYTPYDLTVWVYERRQTSSACSTMHQIGTAHARKCTCCMICVIISALVKCMLVSAGWVVRICCRAMDADGACAEIGRMVSPPKCNFGCRCHIGRMVSHALIAEGPANIQIIPKQASGLAHAKCWMRCMRTYTNLMIWLSGYMSDIRLLRLAPLCIK